MRTVTLLMTLIIATLTGCSQSVSEYNNETPRLSLEQFFQGESRAWGVLHNWQGKQSVRFTAELCGRWQGNSGDLYELFYFNDGRIEQRHWQLQQAADGSVSGTAADVVGQATGQLGGNTLYWQYTLRIPYNGDMTEVLVKDWLYLVDNENLINRSTLHKFGFTVGELTLSIQQQNKNADCAALQQKIQRLIPAAT
jgi:predicted lipid carrier protein YhbT